MMKALVITEKGGPEVLKIEERPAPEPRAGEIESVGERVDSRLSPGDRVVAGTRFGGYAEVAVADARAVVPLPEGWSFEEGAAMPVNYATAYGCLVRYGGLREGERVLIQAAAGGVGIAATQAAKLVGRRGLRHRFRQEARGRARERRRSRDRLPHRGLRQGGAADRRLGAPARPCARRDRWTQLQEGLRPLARRRPARRL